MKTTKKSITIEQALKAANDGKNQEIKRKFVEREVYCNVGSLCEYVLLKGFEDNNAPFTMDDIENYYSYPEWSKTVLGEDLYFEGGSEDDKDTFLENFDRLSEESDQLLEDEKISGVTYERNINIIQDAKSDFENIENEAQEIYEWWAISEYLYSKLKDQNECVVDAGSCYVWGRCTTGQAILLDYSISKICAEMEILEGQSNSWAN